MARLSGLREDGGVGHRGRGRPTKLGNGDDACGSEIARLSRPREDGGDGHRDEGGQWRLVQGRGRLAKLGAGLREDGSVRCRGRGRVAELERMDSTDRSGMARFSNLREDGGDERGDEGGRWRRVGRGDKGGRRRRVRRGGMPAAVSVGKRKAVVGAGKREAAALGQGRRRQWGMGGVWRRRRQGKEAMARQGSSGVGEERGGGGVGGGDGRRRC